MIQLDNNSATQITAEVRHAMDAADQAVFYTSGVIDDSRASVARLLGADNSEIVLASNVDDALRKTFVSALADGGQVVTTAAENENARANLNYFESKGVRVTRVGVDGEGLIDFDELLRALAKRTALVSISHANAEIGVIQPINEVASIVRQNSDALIHVEGTVAAGKIPIDLKNSGIDLYSISAHLIHGPPEAGAIYVRSKTDSKIRLSESELLSDPSCYRTIAGLGVVAELERDTSGWKTVRDLRDLLERKILEQIPDSCLNGPHEPSCRLPNTSNISFENTNGEVIAARLNELGVKVTTGSACVSPDHASSAILQAMNVPYSFAMGSITFALGRRTTSGEIDFVIDVLPGLIADLKNLAGWRVN